MQNHSVRHINPTCFIASEIQSVGTHLCGSSPVVLAYKDTCMYAHIGMSNHSHICTYICIQIHMDQLRCFRRLHILTVVLSRNRSLTSISNTNCCSRCTPAACLSLIIVTTVMRIYLFVLPLLLLLLFALPAVGVICGDNLKSISQIELCNLNISFARN